MKHISIFILFLTFSFYSSGQYIGAMEIEDSSIRTWIPKLEIEYAGIYHFGEGEAEEELRIFFTGFSIIGQIKSGYWEEGTGLWKWTYENLNNIKIEKNGNFICDKYRGQFVIFKDSLSSYKGLKIDNPWNTWIPEGNYEVGIRMEKNLYSNFSGKYPEASYKLLSKSEISSLSSSELKIMRNEIFARYGYKFQKGGEIDNYFRNQKWYKAEHENVDSFLTELELKNISLIKELENKK
jgi:hypothetical protein